MRRFAIYVAVFVAALAVLVLSTSECRKGPAVPDAGPAIPDAATAVPDAATATSTTPQAPDAQMVMIQLAESGSVESAPEGRYLLTLYGVGESVSSEDGRRTADLGSYVESAFGDAGTAGGTLDYDGSRGPVEVTLSAPKVVLTDGGTTNMSYGMEVLKGGQILSKFEKAVLRVRILIRKAR